MVKKIILALDQSQVGQDARTYAISLAKDHKAEILGVSVLDTPWLTASQPEPLGGSTFKIRHDTEVIQSTQIQIDELMQSFKKDCKLENVSAQAIEIEGFPANEIEMASYEADLIVVGKTTDFHFELDQDSDHTVKHIAHNNPRPVIIVPQVPDKSNIILVAYDGKIRSSRALHMFLLLKLGQNKIIHIIHINKNEKEGKEIVSAALKLCQSYEVKAESHIIQSESPPQDVILNYSGILKAEIIVLGGFGNTLLRETLFSSCSKVLLKKSQIPLFIHH